MPIVNVILTRPYELLIQYSDLENEFLIPHSYENEKYKEAIASVPLVHHPALLKSLPATKTRANTELSFSSRSNSDVANLKTNLRNRPLALHGRDGMSK